jgi:regulator of chromosome condensation
VLVVRINIDLQSVAMSNSPLKRDLAALNAAFSAYIEASMQDDEMVVTSWKIAVEDYLAYVRKLSEKYQTQDGILLSWGTGDCGQLGHGMDEGGVWIENKRPRIISGLPTNLAMVAAGGIHNVVLDTNGKVFSWGVNDDCALGRTGVEHTPLPVTIPAGVRIAKVGAGDCHSMAISTDGRIFQWGAFRDKDGKKFFPMGSAKASFKVTQKTPMEMTVWKPPAGTAVVDIVCGSAFNYARLSQGQLYSWGIGENGELGRPVCTMQHEVDGELEYKVDQIYAEHLTPHQVQYQDPNDPTRTRPVEFAKAVGLGAYHALFTMTTPSDGTCVYGTGMNQYSQLGIVDPRTRTEKWRTIPERVTALSKYNICQIQAGEHHTVVLSVDGKVYSFGRGDSGQLGRKGPDNNRGQVAEGFSDGVGRVGGALIGKAIKQISCGSNHTLALSTDGDSVYAWGYGDNGSLGHGKLEDSLFPVELRAKELKTEDRHEVVQVEAGGQHSCSIIYPIPAGQMAKRRKML